MTNIAVLPVLRSRFSGPSVRAWIGAPASTLATSSNISARPEPFGPPSGSRISALSGSVVGSPAAVQHRVRRQRRGGGAGLEDLAVGDRRGRHVEDDRAVAARHRDGDRAGAHAGDAGAVIGHQGRPGAQQHRGATARGDPLRVAADGAGMRGFANERETDAGLLGALHRERRGRHHRDRSETVAAVEHEARAAVLRQPRLDFHIDLAVVDEFQIARQP